MLHGGLMHTQPQIPSLFHQIPTGALARLNDACHHVAVRRLVRRDQPSITQQEANRRTTEGHLMVSEMAVDGPERTRSDAIVQS